MEYTYNGVAATPATRRTTVTIYKYLSQRGAYNPIGFPAPEYGYYGYAYYGVIAQPGAVTVSAGQLPVQETVTQISSNFPGATVRIQGDGGTNANGEVVDTLAILSDSPLPTNLQIVKSQDISVEGIYVRNNTLTFSNATVTMTNNGPYN